MARATSIWLTLAAQEERVITFKKLDSALAEYLKDGNIEMYRQKVSRSSLFF
jgi:hypothetical protein